MFIQIKGNTDPGIARKSFAHMYSSFVLPFKFSIYFRTVLNIPTRNRQFKGYIVRIATNG